MNLAPRHLQTKAFKLWKFTSADGSLLVTLQTRLRQQMASMTAVKRDLVKRLETSKSKDAARRRFEAAKVAAAKVADRELTAQREEQGLSQEKQEVLSPSDLVKRLSSQVGPEQSEDAKKERFEAAKDAAAELAEKELEWQLAQSRADGAPAVAQPAADALQPEGKGRQ